MWRYDEILEFEIFELDRGVPISQTVAIVALVLEWCGDDGLWSISDDRSWANDPSDGYTVGNIG